jgi:hypothetical protein
LERHCTIAHVIGSAAEAQHLSDLAWLRRVRDRIDREYAQPLDVEARPGRPHVSRAPQPRGTYATIILATKDLDGTFERVQACDAEVVQEPIDQPYGIRDCAFRDPAGNHIRINQLL